MDGLTDFNTIDIAVLALLVLGTARGVKQGFTGELLGLASAAAALMAAWALHLPLANHMVQSTRLMPETAGLLSFMSIAGVTYAFVHLVMLALKKMLKVQAKGPGERIGGAALAFVRTLIVSSAAVFLVSLWPHPFLHQAFAMDSLYGRFLYRNLLPPYQRLVDQYPEMGETLGTGFVTQPLPRTGAPCAGACGP